MNSVAESLERENAGSRIDQSTVRVRLTIGQHLARDAIGTGKRPTTLDRCCRMSTQIAEYPLQRWHVREPAWTGAAHKVAADHRAGAQGQRLIGAHKSGGHRAGAHDLRLVSARRSGEPRCDRGNHDNESLKPHVRAFQSAGLARKPSLSQLFACDKMFVINRPLEAVLVGPGAISDAVAKGWRRRRNGLCQALRWVKIGSDPVDAGLECARSGSS